MILPIERRYSFVLSIVKIEGIAFTGCTQRHDLRLMVVEMGFRGGGKVCTDGQQLIETQLFECSI